MAPTSTKINFFSLLTAAILFLLPWTNVTCADTRVATQSGLQAAYGGVSEAGAAQGALGFPGVNRKADASTVAASLLIAVAGISVALGAAVAGWSLARTAAPVLSPAVLAGVALLLIGIQAVIGFPIGKGFDEFDSEVRNAISAQGGANPIAIERTPWFFFELIALAVPVAAFWMERRKLAAPREPLKPPAEVQRD